MNLTNYPKAKEDFEEWLLEADDSEYESFNEFAGTPSKLYELPFMMQYGVFLKFLEEHEIEITKNWVFFNEHSQPKKLFVDSQYGWRIEAVTKAFELLEQRLTK